MNIGSLVVGPDHPCALIAELSNSHNQSLDRALRMIDAAQTAGASAIKIQAYSVDDLIRLRGDGPAPAQWSHMTMRELYTKAATPLEWVPALFAYAAQQRIPIFSSVFGVDGFRVLEDCGNPVYKLAALDFEKTDLLEMVEATGKPIIRSCHEPRAPIGDAFMVYAPKGYPQTDIKLPCIANGYRGFSYHGVNPNMPARSILYGAQLIEVHFHLEHEPSELEANISLNEQAFAHMVTYVRGIECLTA